MMSSGALGAQRAFAFMVLPCLVPCVWSLFGFLRADGNDAGLVVSGAGWALAAVAFLVRDQEVSNVLPGAGPAPAGALTLFLAGAAVLVILVGTVMSWNNFLQRSGIRD